MKDRSLAELESVTEVLRAGVLLHPLRLQVLDLAREPRSASEIAAELDLPRQRVNYHVQALARARFLRREKRIKKRNLYEQRYVATARAYQLSPELLGPLGADRSRIEDRFSAGYLVALGERMQRELGRASQEEEAHQKRLAMLSVDAKFRFASAEQRETFAIALQDAITRLVAEHTNPPHHEDDSPGEGRPYRLVVGCYPIPPPLDTGATSKEESRD